MKTTILMLLLFSVQSFASIEGRWVGDFKVYVRNEVGAEDTSVKSGYVNLILPKVETPNLLFMNLSFGYGFYILGIIGPEFNVTDSNITLNGQTVGSFTESSLNIVNAMDGCTEKFDVINAEKFDNAPFGNQDALIFSYRSECSDGFLLEVTGNLILDPIE